MKVCIIQPKYSTDYSKSEEFFQKELDLLHQCDCTMDIIVLPEASDIPCLAGTKEESEKSAEKFNKILLDECSKTAKKCNSMLFVNARSFSVHNKALVFARVLEKQISERRLILCGHALDHRKIFLLETACPDLFR